MNKNQNQAVDALIEMGYQPEIISLAMAESQNKSLEEVLDLLLFRENHYRKLLKKQQERGIQPKLNKKYSLDDQPKPALKVQERKKTFNYYNDSDGDWLDEDIIDSEVPIEVTQIGFGQIPKNVKLGKSKSTVETRKEDAPKAQIVEESKKSESKDVILKEEDKEGVEYNIESILQELKNVDEKNSEESLDMLNKVLESIKTRVNEANSAFRKEVSCEQSLPKVRDLRAKIYEVLIYIINLDIKENMPNQERLEEVLVKAFEVCLLTPKEMEGLILGYKDLCHRFEIIEKKIVLEQLEKYLLETVNGNVMQGSNRQEIPQEESEQVENSVNGEEFEEKKIEEVRKEPVEIFNRVHHLKADDCVICMEKTREIVFLPCSHFLTCPLCSPRVMKCPMCKKRIDRHLKIYWS